MSTDAMAPHGLALRAYHDGDADAVLVTRRDDGFEMPIPVRHFFRDPAEFTALERRALDECRGRVLDIGAGSGLHTLALQARGLTVTALDVTADAAEIMRARGVRDARCADIMTFRDGPFDTLLLLGHGIGLAGTPAGLERFLTHAATLLAPGGALLLDSLDVRHTTDPRHLAYHARNRASGRYVGAIRMQLVFAGRAGPMCDWLHADPETLRAVAARTGWTATTLAETAHGEYVARLRPGDALLGRTRQP